MIMLTNTIHEYIKCIKHTHTNTIHITYTNVDDFIVKKKKRMKIITVSTLTIRKINKTFQTNQPDEYCLIIA